MNNRKLTQALDDKLPGDRRQGKENNRWVVVDNRKVTRVTYPKGHAGDVKLGTLKSIREQMRLDRDSFERFVACHMTRPEYELHLRNVLGLLPGAVPVQVQPLRRSAPGAPPPELVDDIGKPDPEAN